VALALPFSVGGWLGLLFGAWDYVPWLTSPAVMDVSRTRLPAMPAESARSDLSSA
jgi:hypothetical protein